MKKLFFHILIFGIFWLVCFARLHAQNYAYHWEREPADTVIPLAPPPYDAPFEEWERWQKGVFDYYFDKAYLAFSIDSIHKDSLQTRIYLYAGPKVEWAKFSTQLLPLELKRASWYNSFAEKELYSFHEIRLFLSQIVNWYEQQGYAFASVGLKHTRFENGIAEAEIVPEPGKLYTFAPIEIQGDNVLRKSFIYQLAAYYPGQNYDSQKIQKLIERVKRLAFLKFEKEAELRFYNGQAILTLFLKKVNVSRFDAMVGLLPSLSEEKGFQIAGQAEVDIINGLEQGERLALQWKRPSRGVQGLDLAADYPCVLGTPLGIGLKFDLFKNDTFYLDYSQLWDVNWQVRPGLLAGLTGEFKKINNLLNSNVLSAGSLQEPAEDISTRLFGARIRFYSDAFFIHPAKGYDLELSLSAGSRKIGAAKEDLDPIKGRPQYVLRLKGIQNLPLSSLTAIGFSIQAAAMSGKQLLRPELIRLGGLQSLRGFEDESVLASSYINAMMEYRFFVGEMSFLAVSSNIGFIERHQYGSYEKSLPLGLAAGLNLETRAGIFSFYYAWGYLTSKTQSRSQSRVHLGLRNFF